MTRLGDQYLQFMNKVISEVLSNIFMPLFSNSNARWMCCCRHCSQTSNSGIFIHHRTEKIKWELVRNESSLTNKGHPYAKAPFNKDLQCHFVGLIHEDLLAKTKVDMLQARGCLVADARTSPCARSSGSCHGAYEYISFRSVNVLLQQIAGVCPTKV